jgi:hypothetical protein
VQNYNQPLLYHPDPYRAADHDPIVVCSSDGEAELSAGGEEVRRNGAQLVMAGAV